ncbi:MAG: protein kinase [Calditrichaeota bacterium]|nr:protein kinase [Calditrichota bacterium]
MIGRTISHYKILEKIGEGGMGVVYKALDTRLKREVAIKFLPERIANNPDARQRFLLEAQAAAALNHPNIATIYEIDEVDDLVFFAMEYIRGENLKDKLNSGRLDLTQCLSFIRQIAAGLQAAHRKQIAHRDIKSENIMLTEDGRVKVMDFGLAKSGEQGGLKETAVISGTPAYMSPELLQDAEVDYRTDIWSFGVVIYEMLSGELPFQGMYESALLYAISHEEPPSLKEFRADIPDAWNDVVAKILQKNPAQRYQDIGELLNDLEAIDRPAAAGSGAPAISDAGNTAIAVLPFRDMSPGKDQEYFCDGIAEELIDALAKLEGWRVVSRTSSFAFKGKEDDIRRIGEQLNVAHIIEGSVRKAGKRLRITAQLNSVHDGYQLWSEKYDREMEDVFEIQEEIARAIVSKLSTQLPAAPTRVLIKRHTEDLEAHTLYLKARYHLHKRSEEGLKKAIEFCEEAIRKDPTYALAYSGLADSYILQSFMGTSRPQEVLPLAKTAALKALSLDQTVAEAHTSLACIKTVYDWNWSDAESDFRQAFSHNPSYATAHHWFAINFLVPQKRFEEAFEEMRHAQSLDPVSPVIHATFGLIWYFAGDFEKAVNQYLQVLELNPDFQLANLFLGRSYEQLGLFDASLEAFRKVTPREDDQEVLGDIGRTLARAGKTEEAQVVLLKLKDLYRKKSLSPYAIYSAAALASALGEPDQAIDWLNKAFAEQSSRLIYLGVDPVFAELAGDPRFRKMLQKLNL